jgi:uncharacterized protein with PIN domain
MMAEERIALAEPEIIQCPWCKEVNRPEVSPQLEIVEDGRGMIPDIWLCNTCAKVFAAGDTRTRPQGDGDDGELDSVVERVH